MRLPINPFHTATGVTLPTSYRWREPRRPWAAGFVFLGLALLLGACASSPSRRPPSADVNLSGFPPEFKQGYGDGCSSAKGARVRDEARFRSDSQYASGWRDGYDICRRK